MNTTSRNIDILSVGEALIDFIGQEADTLIDNTRDFHRYLGGSPTNVAMNSARLGLKTTLVASVGEDGFGDYILKRIEDVGIDSRYIVQSKKNPTSTIFVSRSSNTPDFIPYREADYHISEDQIPKDLLLQTKLFHTTCFALSKDPAQTTILAKAREAFILGCKLSIDVNYSEKIWSNREQALEVIKKYCSFNPLVKISEDDVTRLFLNKLTQKEVFAFFHSNGVETVCLTMGKNGVILSQLNKPQIKLPAIKINKIMDATGAGDAFWSGFLFAYIKEYSMKETLHIALKLAALKLQNVGRLPDNINILTELLE